MVSSPRHSSRGFDSPSLTHFHPVSFCSRSSVGRCTLSGISSCGDMCKVALTLRLPNITRGESVSSIAVSRSHARSKPRPTTKQRIEQSKVATKDLGHARGSLFMGNGRSSHGHNGRILLATLDSRDVFKARDNRIILHPPNHLSYVPRSTLHSSFSTAIRVPQTPNGLLQRRRCQASFRLDIQLVHPPSQSDSGLRRCVD